MMRFPSQQSLQPPARRGPTLGWRLGLSTALIITVVMGGISVSQQLLSQKREEAIHRELLRNLLAPLAIRLGDAGSIQEMRRLVQELHDAYRDTGTPRHDFVLSDAAGSRVLSTQTAGATPETSEVFTASLLFDSTLLNGGEGTITVLKSNEEFRAGARREWQLWGVHLVSTIVVVTLFLGIATHFLVTKPVNRLIRGVRKMERGYWGSVEPGGAWEIRWLAWRFTNMAREVRSSANRLSQAERKAWTLMSEPHDGHDLPEPSSYSATEDSGPDVAGSPMYERLNALCDRLEMARPSDSGAVSLAQSVSADHALEAGRLGYYELKARLEDAALKIVAPSTFEILTARLDKLRADWGGWASGQRSVMLQALERRGIPCVRLLHRVKHTAGVHAKMRGKDLDLDEIHDLFAFRIVVPTETDCYAALGVIHQLYEAEVSRFKDYVAEPKENGYQALHTCVRSEGAPLFEVQIRSVAMDQLAERGDAVHWQYKAGQSAYHALPLPQSSLGALWKRIGQWGLGG